MPFPARFSGCLSKAYTYMASKSIENMRGQKKYFLPRSLHQSQHRLCIQAVIKLTGHIL